MAARPGEKQNYLLFIASLRRNEEVVRKFTFFSASSDDAS
jgi:hypothetical protein